MKTCALAWLTLCLVPGLTACSDDGDDDYTTDAKTLVAVDSADFPSSANCAVPKDASAPRSAYVAELFDVSQVVEAGGESLDPFLVQSSKPTACGKSIGFGRVEPDRNYELVVRVYPDADANPATMDICTVSHTGVAVLRTEGKCTEEIASPSSVLRCYGWQQPTSAGKGADAEAEGEPVLAIEYRTTYASYCVESAD